LFIVHRMNLQFFKILRDLCVNLLKTAHIVRYPLFHTYIFFDDFAVDAGALHFFPPFLDEGIVVDGDGEIEGFCLPVVVDVIVEVFGILVTGQGVAAAACVEVIGGIFFRRLVVFEKGEVGVVDDLYHRLIFCVIGDDAVALCNGDAPEEAPGAVDRVCGRCRLPDGGLTGDEEDDSK